LEITVGKPPKNHGKQWTSGEVKQLKTELKQNTPTGVLGIKHGRTPGAVQAKVNNLGLSTKPTNQSPRTPKGKRK
jgi:hypothetical protein